MAKTNQNNHDIADWMICSRKTVMWEPSMYPQASSCSTPTHQSSWAEVVVWSHKGVLDGVFSPPSLNCSNCYITLSENNLSTQLMPYSSSISSRSAPESSACWYYYLSFPTSDATTLSQKLPLQTHSEDQALHLNTQYSSGHLLFSPTTYIFACLMLSHTAQCPVNTLWLH